MPSWNSQRLPFLAGAFLLPVSKAANKSSNTVPIYIHLLWYTIRGYLKFCKNRASSIEPTGDAICAKLKCAHSRLRESGDGTRRKLAQGFLGEALFSVNAFSKQKKGFWGGRDLNPRHNGLQPFALPGCATTPNYRGQLAPSTVFANARPY